MKHSRIHPLFLAVLLVAGGCSKEKASALKTAAESARTQAIAAVQSVQTLIERSIAMPSETREEKIKVIVSDFAQPGPLTAATFDFIVTDDEIGDPTRKALVAEFEKLQSTYRAFGAMFRSLPDGSYFSAAAVKKAEAHAIRLSMEFISFAQVLNKLPGVFAGERVVLIESINRAKKLPMGAREELLRKYASDALQLRTAERAAREKATVECLRAATGFKTTAELIRGYSKISAADMLTMTKEILTTANDISGNQADVQKLLGDFTTIKDRIGADPYWSLILQRPFNP